jgi:hypothetical protein
MKSNANASKLKAMGESCPTTVTLEQLVTRIGYTIAHDAARAELIAALQHAWPLLCKQVELKLLAKGRERANHAQLLGAQLEAFLTDLPAGPQAS